MSFTLPCPEVQPVIGVSVVLEVFRVAMAFLHVECIRSSYYVYSRAGIANARVYMCMMHCKQRA